MSASSTASARRPGGRGRSRPRRAGVSPSAADSGNSSNNRHNAALVPLDGASRLFVKQHVEMFEAMTGWETANSYSVLDDRGQPLYNVMEESGACMRQCCKSNRSFTLHVCDTRNREVIRIERPYRFYWQQILVRDVGGGGGGGGELGEGAVLGTVERTFAFLSRSFRILDRDGRHLFNINAPFYSPWTFYLYDAQNGDQQIGTLSKKWSGLAQELFTDADNFGIEFPAGLRANAKALLMAAVFLIDFMYFEDNDMNSRRSHRGRGGGFGGGFRTNMF